MRSSTILLILLLLGLAACKPPVPAAEAHERALEAAAKAASETVPAAQREDFVEGFRMGARMVWAAASSHRTPWLPVLGQPAPPPLPEAARAMGAKVVRPESALKVEVDPGTGFPLKEVDPEGGLGPGELAGFAWALAPLKEQLCHPAPPPAFPETGTWKPWTPPGLHLWDRNTPKLQVQATWVGNALVWSSVDQGFPPEHGWRSMEDGSVPVALALRDRCLWIATKQEGCFALDLKHGLIVAVHAQGLVPGDLEEHQTEKDWKTQLKQEEEEDRKHRPLWLTLAAQGNTQAMMSLAYSSETDEETVD
ncbi:MAG TPA: hypothetical protein VF768_02425, partial [Holophagaceae bacterium]